MLRSDVDNPSGRSCGGCSGEFGKDCTNEIVCVQYSSAHAEPQFFCEEHGSKQADWDEIIYDSPPPEAQGPTIEATETMDKLLKRARQKLEQKKKKKNEEYDPS
jgi:hypothetical protein